MQIMPVTAVEKHTVGDGKVGTMTKGLQKSFDEFIKKECPPQGVLLRTKNKCEQSK
jgi:hypothetical protein